jgi:hypothetical protein
MEGRETRREEKKQALKRVAEGWNHSIKTGFGTHTFDSREVEIPGGKLIIYTNLDPTVWRKPKRGSRRWQNAEDRSQLTLVKN